MRDRLCRIFLLAADVTLVLTVGALCLWAPFQFERALLEIAISVSLIGVALAGVSYLLSDQFREESKEGSVR